MSLREHTLPLGRKNAYWLSAREIVAGLPYTFSTDLWSLGASLITCLTGFPPFEVGHPIFYTIALLKCIWHRQTLCPRYSRMFPERHTLFRPTYPSMLWTLWWVSFRRYTSIVCLGSKHFHLHSSYHRTPGTESIFIASCPTLFSLLHSQQSTLDHHPRSVKKPNSLIPPRSILPDHQCYPQSLFRVKYTLILRLHKNPDGWLWEISVTTIWETYSAKNCLRKLSPLLDVLRLILSLAVTLTHLTRELLSLCRSPWGMHLLCLMIVP